MANKYVMAGVMGWPVAHSRSPTIHNHWIRQYGLQGAYGMFPVQPGKLEDAIRGLPALGLGDPLRAFVDRQEAADAVAGAVGIIEPRRPQELAREAVELAAQRAAPLLQLLGLCRHRHWQAPPFLWPIVLIQCILC